MVADRLKPGPQPKLTARDKFELRQFRESGVSIKDCAAYKGVSVATCLKALAELRQKLGPEKLPNERRARSFLGRRELVNQ